jgi:hypothetical protein
MHNYVWVSKQSKQRVYRSAPKVTYASYRNLTQKLGNRFKISKAYSTEKFNSEFSTWWFQIMLEYYDNQILRAKPSAKLKIPFSIPTKMSHHDYLHRKTANELLMIIINKEVCEGEGFLKITFNSILSVLMCSQFHKNYKMLENHSKYLMSFVACAAHVLRFVSCTNWAMLSK